MTTKIIVGLGNPGAEYANTRHNAGFMVVDALIEQTRGLFHKSQADYDSWSNDELILVKPSTYMNLSGQAVKGIIKSNKLKAPKGDDYTDSLLIVHDDLDLAPDQIQFKTSGGSAGHNGIKDILTKVDKDFGRLRVGIGPAPEHVPSEKYVLEQIKAPDQAQLAETVALAAQAAFCWLDDGISTAQNKYN